jgi:hypothetical protein
LPILLFLFFFTRPSTTFLYLFLPSPLSGTSFEKLP